MNSTEGEKLHGGSLCSLSWDLNDLGLGVIVGFAPKFVYMWPAIENPEGFSPGVKCRINPRGNENLWVYPELETPVGRYLLDDCYGQAESVKRLKVIRDQLGKQDLYGITRSQFEDIGKLSNLAETWRLAMNIDSPEDPVGNRPFNPQVLRKYGITQQILAKDLELRVPQVAALLTGRRIPTNRQVRAVANLHGAQPQDLLGPGLKEAEYLMQPRSKKNVQIICKELDMTEEHARRSILDQLVLAARTTGDAYNRIDSITREIVRTHAESN